MRLCGAGETVVVGPFAGAATGPGAGATLAGAGAGDEVAGAGVPVSKGGAPFVICPSAAWRSELALSSCAVMASTSGRAMSAVCSAARSVGEWGCQIAGNRSENVPALIGVAPGGELPDPCLQHLVGMEDLGKVPLFSDRLRRFRRGLRPAKPRSAHRQSLDLGDDLLRRDLPAIAAIIAQRCLVALPRVSGTCIGDQRHEIAKIAGVAHRRIDALVGEESRDDEGADAEIAQHIIDYWSR